MRKTLIAAVALAPFCIPAGVAQATTTIGSSQSTAIQTATVKSGAADDVIINSGVTVSITGAGTAASPNPVVTVNSSNILTNSGTISTTDISNVVGVLIKGGVSGSVSNNGAITLSSSFAAPTSVDGYAQGPFAGTASSTNTSGTGVYGLYGIRLTGTSPFAGSILNASTGAISIKGNQSYGVSLETEMTGAFTSAGTISVVGDNSVGILSLANAKVDAGLSLSGTVNVQGTGSSAVLLNGDVGSKLGVYSSVSATGYALTTRTTDPTLLGKLTTTSNNQINKSGIAFLVGGNVGQGIYIGGAPSGTVSGSTADVTGDGTADGSEGSGSINSFGDATALQIGSTISNTVIGGFVSNNSKYTQDNGYGLVMRGAVTASGVYDGVDATALVIGTSGGTTTTSLSSGAKIYGSVSASSYNANATAIRLYSGASVPDFQVGGSISASINASTKNVTATAMQFEQGSTVNSLVVTGAIVSAAVGDNATANGVIDKSGTLSSVLNEGAINASNAVTSLGDTQTGSVTALDLSRNTSGILLIQKTNPNPNHDYGSSSTDATITTTSLTAATPSIVGDVLLGSGTNTVKLLAGSLTGALDMGSGTGGSLTIDNGATLTGALRFSGTGLIVSVPNGVLDNHSATTVNLASMTIGANSTLGFAADPANNAATKYVATGPITIASGVKFNLTLLSTPTADQTYTLIQSPNLTLGSTSTTLATTSPYLVQAAISSTPSAGTVSLNIRRKTQAELGLSNSEGAILNAVYTVMPKDPEVQNAILAQTAKAPFIRVYDQLLPESAGALFEAARASSDAVTRATAAHDQAPGAAGTRGFWGQEFVVGGHGDRSADNIDFDYAGFGVVGGMAMGGSGLGAFGVTAAFSTITVTNPLIKGDSQQALSNLEAGIYWQGTVQHLALDARLGVAASSIDGRRQLYSIAQDGTVAVNRQVKDNRNGFNYTVHAGASYEYTLGDGYFVRPQLRIDYFGMSEDSYKEVDTVTSTSAFALSVNSRSGSVGSATASLVFGRSIGADFRLRPELELGVRDAFGGGAGSTTAQFVSGGGTFKLTPTDLSGAGGVMRFGLRASTDFYDIGLTAGVEARSHFESADARVTVRLLF